MSDGGVLATTSFSPGQATSERDIRQARDASSLGRLIEPVALDVFFADYWERNPLVVHRDDRDHNKDILSLVEFDDILANSELRSTVRVVKNGQPLPISKLADSPVDANRGGGDVELTFQEYRNGSTLVFPFLHHRTAALRHLARSLSSELSADIQINAYLTPAQARGFAAHYDTHDVLVLQVHGSKRWRIYPSPIRLPLERNAFRAVDGFDPGEPIEDFTLEQGDVLYLPRGFVHEAASERTTSLHLTIGIKPITWSSVVLDAVTALIDERPELRRALPPGFATDPRLRDQARSTLMDLMSQVHREVDLGAAIDDARTQVMLFQLPELTGHLIDLDTEPSLDLHSSVRRRPDVEWYFEGNDADDEICLVFHGKRVCMPRRLMAELRFITAADTFTANELPGDLDGESRLLLIRRLLREGFLSSAGLPVRSPMSSDR